jgi:vacuolar-type H+-ATPase subunit H
MDNNILRDIIDVEKEIQQSLEREKVKTREWLDVRKKEIESDSALQEQNIRQSYQQSLENAKREASKIASELFEQSKLQTEMLAHLENDVLSTIVTNHISKILPG